MSWDIFVQDFPQEARSAEDIPEDFQPAPLGRRSEIIAKIREVIPSADFSDPSWGLIEGEGWSIEVNIGQEEECDSFAFHVRGGDGAVPVVEAILRHLGFRALDAQTGDFFSGGPVALESFREWSAYRDGIGRGS